MNPLDSGVQDSVGTVAKPINPASPNPIISQVVEEIFNRPVPLQPKAYNRQLFKEAGRLVPEIFDSLETGFEWLVAKGVNTGARIILRSEHPKEGEIKA